MVQITGQAWRANTLYEVRNCLAVSGRESHQIAYTHIRPKQVQIKFGDLAGLKRLDQVSLGDVALN